MKQPITLAVNGAGGRMGQRIVALAHAADDLRIVAALEAPTSPLLGRDAGEVAGVGNIGVEISSELVKHPDVVIDFSLPAGLLAITAICEERQIPLVAATTGLSDEQKQTVLAAAQKTPLLFAPSMSLAVNLAMKLVREAAAALKHLPGGVDVEIIERHHRFKEDAPSGTALKFGEIVAEQMGWTSHVHGRSGHTGKRPPDEIGYHALRTGDNVGEHQIVFGMLGETLEVYVRGHTRDSYAYGALAAARFVVKQRPGVYTMADVLGLCHLTLRQSRSVALTEYNPLRTFATDVVRQLTVAGYVALWAGGCVRDLMLGREPQDYDVATDARPVQVREVFGRRRTHAVGESFGVILVLESGRKGRQVEVATFRTEGVYSDGRRPDSVEFCTAEEDARRRDFTINGMFFDPLQESVLDYVGGEADLGQGIVRAIGDAHARMNEDKLRMLRAPRFTATLDFQLDETTAEAIRAMAGEIRVVSWERITQELQKMLVDQHRERAIRLCHDLGLLAIILPELAVILPLDGDPTRRESHVGSPASRPPDPAARQWWHTLHMLGNLTEPSFELALAALLHTVPSPVEQSKRQPLNGTVRGICRRMRLSNHQTDRVSWLVAHQRDLDEAADMPLARLKRLLVHEHIDELLTLARLSAMAEQREPEGIDFAADYLTRTPVEVLNPPELIDGADLQSLGLSPGPQFKEILTRVRDAQLNEQISTREEAIAIAKQLAEQ